MMQGTIKALRSGFGFISAEGAADHFFHASEVKGVKFDDLKPGQSVTFEPVQGPKGPRAENVVPVRRGR